MRDEGGVGWVIWGWFEWAGKQLSSWWCLVLLVFELLWALVKFRFQSHRLGDFGFIESSFTVVETLTTNARGQQFQATLHLEDLKWMNYKWITYLKSNVWTKLRETFGVHWSMLCPSLQSFQSLHYLLRNRRLFEHTACNAFFFLAKCHKMRKMQILRILFFLVDFDVFLVAFLVSWGLSHRWWAELRCGEVGRGSHGPQRRSGCRRSGRTAGVLFLRPGSPSLTMKKIIKNRTLY